MHVLASSRFDDSTPEDCRWELALPDLRFGNPERLPTVKEKTQTNRPKEIVTSSYPCIFTLPAATPVSPNLCVPPRTRNLTNQASKSKGPRIALHVPENSEPQWNILQQRSENLFVKQGTHTIHDPGSSQNHRTLIKASTSVLFRMHLEKTHTIAAAYVCSPTASMSFRMV